MRLWFQRKTPPPGGVFLYRQCYYIYMQSTKVWFFLLLAAIFAAVHYLATVASLYWYYPWLDIVMHLWGGILVALGVVVLASFKSARIKPTLQITLSVLFVAMVSWEIFERMVGLYSQDTYIFDVSKDIFFGLLGGLIGYLLFRKRTKKI